MSWVLIFFVWGNPGGGGPATVQGFTSETNCMLTGARFKREIPRVDWFKCEPADIQVASPERTGKAGK